MEDLILRFTADVTPRELQMISSDTQTLSLSSRQALGSGLWPACAMNQ